MAFDRGIWTRPMAALHPVRDRAAIVDRALWLLLGLLVGFLAGIVTIG